MTHSIPTVSKKTAVIFIVLLVAIINFLTMPAVFYAGDAYTIKLEAAYLVRNGEFGFRESESQKISEFTDAEDQYFKLNKTTGRFHNRWGLFNLAVYVLPELVNTGKSEFTGNEQIYLDDASILSHNIFNCLLSIVVAVFLFKTAVLYTRKLILQISFVLLILYASFVWNYLRAQTYEIIQLTLFTLFYYYLIIFLRSARNSRNLISYHSFYFFNLFLGGLCLTKSFYFYLYPFVFFTVFAKLYLGTNGRYIHNLYWNMKQLMWVVIPGLLTMFTYLVFSYLFYGEIFFGHLHYLPHADETAFSYIFIPDRLYDYFISDNRSLLVHMPLLLPGLVGFRWYLQKHRYEACFLLGSFLFAIIFFSFCYTVGEDCYGPRFFIFILPALCLPGVYLFEKMALHRSYVAMSAVLAVLILVSFITLRGQISVNSRDFHLPYILKANLDKIMNVPPEINYYFSHANFAVIARDTNDLFADGHTGYLSESLSAYLQLDREGEEFRRLSKLLAINHRRNYFLENFYNRVMKSSDEDMM